MTYAITKAECESRIKGICEGCGGPLSAIETVDNSGNPTFWQGCTHCECFRSGVSPKHFKIARKLIEEEHWHPLRYMDEEKYEDSPERKRYWVECQTAELARQIAQIDHLLAQA